MRYPLAPTPPYALVPLAGPEDDGVVGDYDEDQKHVADPARPPLTAARAREMTAGLREAMDDVRRSVAVLAARVRDAHAARVWVPLGHGSWESYCAAEFGISRAQAYRLQDVARSLAAIRGTVAAGTQTSVGVHVDALSQVRMNVLNSAAYELFGLVSGARFVSRGRSSVVGQGDQTGGHRVDQCQRGREGDGCAGE